jgi:hypothetical protein
MMVLLSVSLGELYGNCPTKRFYLNYLLKFRPYTQKEMERELKDIVTLAGERVHDIIPSYLFQVPRCGMVADNYRLRDVFIWAPEKECSDGKPLCPGCKLTGKNVIRQGYLESNRDCYHEDRKVRLLANRWRCSSCLNKHEKPGKGILAVH